MRSGSIFPNRSQPLPKRQILDASKLKELQTTVSNFMTRAESSQNRYKTLWEKEKLLVMSNFSFFHRVFKKVCTADT